MKKPSQADDITTEISNLVISANRAGTLQGRNAKDHVICLSNEAWHELREATGVTGFLANVCIFGLTLPVRQSQQLPPGVRMSIQIRKPYGPGPVIQSNTLLGLIGCSAAGSLKAHLRALWWFSIHLKTTYPLHPVIK